MRLTAACTAAEPTFFFIRQRASTISFNVRGNRQEALINTAACSTDSTHILDETTSGGRLLQEWFASRISSSRLPSSLAPHPYGSHTAAMRSHHRVAGRWPPLSPPALKLPPQLNVARKFLVSQQVLYRHVAVAACGMPWRQNVFGCTWLSVVRAVEALRRIAEVKDFLGRKWSRSGLKFPFGATTCMRCANRCRCGHFHFDCSTRLGPPLATRPSFGCVE